LGYSLRSFKFSAYGVFILGFTFWTFLQKGVFFATPVIFSLSGKTLSLNGTA
jgi:hypothetical protein